MKRLNKLVGFVRKNAGRVACAALVGLPSLVRAEGTAADMITAGKTQIEALMVLLSAAAIAVFTVLLGYRAIPFVYRKVSAWWGR